MSAHATTDLIAEIQKAAQQLRNGRRVDALLIYDEVAKRANGNVPVNIELGHLCSELGSSGQAVAHYRMAVDHEPDNAHYLGYLSMLRKVRKTQTVSWISCPVTSFTWD